VHSIGKTKVILSVKARHPRNHKYKGGHVMLERFLFFRAEPWCHLESLILLTREENGSGLSESWFFMFVSGYVRSFFAMARGLFFFRSNTLPACCADCLKVLHCESATSNFSCFPEKLFPCAAIYQLRLENSAFFGGDGLSSLSTCKSSPVIDTGD
jgi:hypothetical protein